VQDDRQVIAAKQLVGDESMRWPRTTTSNRGGARLPALGEYLRRLRTARKLTQAELAARSTRTGFPVDQSFVSRLERGEISGSVGKFFAVLSLIHANPASVAELVHLAQSFPPEAETGDIDELLSRARSSTAHGRLSEALGWAVAALHEASENDRADDHARALIATSIVLKNQGAWETARAVAFEALNLDGSRPVTHLCAVLECAACSLEMDEPVTARLLLDGVRGGTLDSRPDLAAQRAHMLGLAFLQERQSEHALEAFLEAAEHYARSPSPSDEARLHARLAVLLAERGDRNAAIRAANRAIALAEEADHLVTRTRVLLRAGRVDILVGRSAEARHRLAEAEELAEQLGHGEFLFEARLWRLALAVKERDGTAIGVLRHVLRRARRGLRIGRDLSTAYAHLVEGSAGGGGTN